MRGTVFIKIGSFTESLRLNQSSTDSTLASMKVLFIFALVFAASTIVQADVEEGITTILNGFGTLFKDLGDLLQNPDKIKDLAHRFVGTLKI